MLNKLSKIAKVMNSKEIIWAVGGSLVLKNYKLINEVNDIDLFVAEKDIESVVKIMNSLGVELETEKKGIYTTKYFYKYRVWDVDIDIMSGFGLKHSEGEFNYIFNQQSITNYIRFEDEKIPFTSLEDWFVIYQLLPDREYKVRMIEQYFSVNEIENIHILYRALDGCLPRTTIKRIKSLMNC